MSPRTVLLADADADSRTVYSLMLEHHGFRVLHARDGAEAHRVAREQRPDLIVVDLFFPLVEGRPLTALFRQDERTAGVPLIGLTSLPTSLGLARGLLDCDTRLVKPCTPSRLLWEVERLLDDSALPPAAPGVERRSSAIGS